MWQIAKSLFFLTKSLVLLTALFSTSALGANHFYGVTASNALGNRGSYTCRSQSDWNSMATEAKKAGFDSIRIMSFDCDALERASAAAKNAGIKLLVGIWINGTVKNSNAQIDKDVQAFRKAHAKYGASLYIGLTIGNEVWGDKPANVVNKMYSVRSYLRSVGINTAVSTVDSWVHVRDNPALCGGSFAAANAHVFFDGGRTPTQSGDFIFNVVVPALKKACPGKKIYITETGWTARGPPNNKAVASVDNERKAIHSINCAAKSDPNVRVFAFEYDDQTWKNLEREKGFGLTKVWDAVSSC